MGRRQHLRQTQYRILIVGDAAVGKSALIARYIRDEYPCNTRNSNNSIDYSTVIDGSECLLTFVEVPSSHDVRQMDFLPSMLTACLLLFSVVDERSFAKIKYFEEAVRTRFSGQLITIPIVVVANKIDLEQERVVGEQKLNALESNGVHVFETSVKTNLNITQAIETSVRLLRHEQHHLLETISPKRFCACIVM